MTLQEFGEIFYANLSKSKLAKHRNTFAAAFIGLRLIFAVFALELPYHFGPDLKLRFKDSLIGAIVAS